MVELLLILVLSILLNLDLENIQLIFVIITDNRGCQSLSLVKLITTAVFLFKVSRYAKLIITSGTISCANGDTWASEFGTVLTDATPRLITNWKHVPRGKFSKLERKFFSYI